LGAIFLFWAYRTLFRPESTINSKAVGLIEGVAGVLLIVGLWTQVAALVALIDFIVRLIGKIMRKAFLTDGVNYYLVLLVLALSLIVTGAGWLAFDLPL